MAGQKEGWECRLQSPEESAGAKCGADVASSKGTHPLPDSEPAGKAFGWACDDCLNTFPANATASDAPEFNDRMTAIRVEPRGGSERWIPVPASSLLEDGSHVA